MNKNITAAIKSLDAELEAGQVEQDDLVAYLAELDRVIEAARAVKALYAKQVAVLASQRSRAKRAERMAALEAEVQELRAQK